MALVVKDRVMETTSSTGTGTITLGGSVAGYQSFSVVGDGNTTYYAIDGGSEWEVGIGTYTASGTTLSRDTVLESSNSGSLVNFSSGTKNVFVTYPAEKSVDIDSAQTLTNKTISGSSNTLSNIGNSSLTNSSITINGTPVSLGGSASVGTVTSVGVTAGTGISVSGSPVTGSGSITVTNTAPDQTVSLTAGTGISTSGTYPNFTITNSAPDQTVSLTAGSNISVTGTYPNFTIAATGGSGTVTSITAGTGLTGGTITTSGTIAIDSTVTTLTGTQTLTNKTLTSPTVTGAILNDGYTEEVFAITDGASVVLNPNNGSIQTWTLGANRAPTVSGWNNGQSMTLMINNGAAYTIDWTGISGTLIPFAASSTSQNFGSSTSGTLTLPTGLQTGDIVIVGIGSGGSTPALPSGWTNINNSTSTSEFTRTFYKEMGATPDTSVAISGISVATVGFVVVVKQGNVSGITSAVATRATGMPNPASLASVQAGSLVLAIGYLDDDNVASSVTAPSGYTLLEVSQATTTGQTVMVAYTIAETAGTYDPGAFGGTGTDDWVGLTVAISGGAGVNWTTDNGYAPTLNDVGYTSVVLWEVGDVIYGARVGNK